MEMNHLALGLAGAALLFASVCVVLYAKLRPPSTLRHPQEEPEPVGSTPLATNADEGAEEAEEQEVERDRSAASPQAEREPPSHRFRVASGSGIQQCLFVVFDWPAKDTNRRLATRLETFGAHYDRKQQVYIIRDPRARYRLTVANATPPGNMPPLHEGGELPIVQGVSVLVHFVNKRRVANSPETLIDFTLSVAEIGGKILDADRQEVTEADFELLRGASV